MSTASSRTLYLVREDDGVVWGNVYEHDAHLAAESFAGRLVANGDSDTLIDGKVFVVVKLPDGDQIRFVVYIDFEPTFHAKMLHAPKESTP